MLDTGAAAGAGACLHKNSCVLPPCDQPLNNLDLYNGSDFFFILFVMAKVS